MSAGGAGRGGAAEGARVGLVYAAVECVFASIVPFLRDGPLSFEPVHHGLTALAFLIHPACGAALGFAIGRATGAFASAGPSSPRWRDRIRSVVLLILIAGFSFGYLGNHERTSLFVLSGAILAAVVVVTKEFAASIPERTPIARILPAGPWTVVFLLLGIPWVTKDVLAYDDGQIVRGIAVLSAFGVVMLISLVARASGAALRRRLGAIPLPSPATATSLVAGGTFVASLFCNPQGIRTTSAEVAPPGPSDRLPDVLLISLDTVRASNLSVYGYARRTTPRLEELARHATSYTRAIATSDMTLGSHASMFTGLYPSEHHAHWSRRAPEGNPLAERFETLAERLAMEGYETFAFVANHSFLGYDYGLTQGFREYDARQPTRLLLRRPAHHLTETFRSLLAAQAPRDWSEMRFRRADEILDGLFARLDRRDRSRPFFAFVNFMDAHWPYLPPAPFDRMFPGKDEGFGTESYRELRRRVNQRRGTITERERTHLLSQYDAAIAYLDDRIGHLIARLRELGLYDDCLVIVTSDHGEAFGERNLLEHGVSAYQDQVHVPLLIKYPGQRKPERDDRVASHVDVTPTVLEVANLPIPDGLAGRSLVSRDGDDDRVVFAESFPSGVLRKWHERFRREERAVYRGWRKLVWSTAGKRELYDLVEDPGETRNVYRSGDPSTEALEGALDRWLRSLPEEASASPQIDPGTIERLRALGYAQ